MIKMVAVCIDKAAVSIKRRCDQKQWRLFLLHTNRALHNNAHVAGAWNNCHKYLISTSLSSELHTFLWLFVHAHVQFSKLMSKSSTLSAKISVNRSRITPAPCRESSLRLDRAHRFATWACNNKNNNHIKLNISWMLPDNVGVRELLQQADFSYNAVLVYVIFVDFHHHHFPTGAVNHLKDIRAR